MRRSDLRAAAARRARGGLRPVPVAFVPAPDPAAEDEPPRPPEAASDRYVWRGALPDSARMHQGTVYPPCAGWLLRDSASGRAVESRPYSYPDGSTDAPEGHGDPY